MVAGSICWKYNKHVCLVTRATCQLQIVHSRKRSSPLTQMTSCITMTGTISAHSDQKGVCTGGRSYYWRITIVYLHPEVLDGHVLLVDVHGVVLGHREHLLQVVLNIGAVLMVDCVSVARYWGTLVLKVVGLGSMTIEAYYES